MKCRSNQADESLKIETLFRSVFTRSESEAEGALLGELVKELMASTDEQDLFGFVSLDGDQIIAAIFFSRLTFEENIEAFMLSPVAVDTDQQGKGVGQKLINYGLNEMKKRGVEVVVTYGDPAYYSRVGFLPLSEETIQPPFVLSQPEGWLGQSFANDSVQAVSGSCSCVKAFHNPDLW